MHSHTASASSGPAGWVAAAAFGAIALLCAASLARHRGGAPRVAAAEANHVVMAVAMAVMVAPGGTTLVPAGPGAVVFGALTLAWLLVLLELRRRHAPLGSPIGAPRCSAHPTHLLLVNAAMTVMYAVMLPGTGADGDGSAHTGHGHGGGGSALGTVGVVLALYLLVQAIATVAVVATARTGEGPTAPAPPGPRARDGAGAGGVAVLARPPQRVARLVTAPATQLLCQAAMGVGMAAMLLVGH